jgi:hypothetical protein
MVQKPMSLESITVKAFIGSNNKTGELEVDKMVEVISKEHDGFTLDYPIMGYWKGKAEDTAVLYLNDTKYKVLQTLEMLKLELEQEAIAYQVEPYIYFI